MCRFIIHLAFVVGVLLGVTFESSAAVVRCSGSSSESVCSKQPTHPKIGASAPFRIRLGSKQVNVSDGITLAPRPGPIARYSLSITSVPSQRLTELSPVTVGFTFQMQASRLTSSDIIYICSASPDANLPCYEIRNPQNNQQYSGTVQVEVF